MDRFERVLMNAEAAELLNFVDITKRTVTLEGTGEKFLAANHHDKRLIWQEQLPDPPLCQSSRVD